VGTARFIEGVSHDLFHLVFLKYRQAVMRDRGEKIDGSIY
jgi:hypothetical protein